MNPQGKFNGQEVIFDQTGIIANLVIAVKQSHWRSVLAESVQETCPLHMEEGF